MPRSSARKLAWRRLDQKVRLKSGFGTSEPIYADATPHGTIIDHTAPHEREVSPIALEVWLPQTRAWQVISSFPSYDAALPSAKKTAEDEKKRWQNSDQWKTYRLRHRRTGDIIPCDIL